MAVQLLNSSPDPRGNRYSELDREGAYLCWRVAGRRSFSRTAELVHVAETTLRSWSHADDWVGRARQDDAQAIELMRDGLAAVVVAEVVRSLDTLIELRDGAKTERVRLDAALAVMGLAGVAPVSKVETAIITPRPAPLPAIDYDRLSDEELEALASRIGR